MTKWLIKPKRELTPAERRSYWELAHQGDAYKNVFSITEDEAIRDKILAQLGEIGNVRTVLVPGCGSYVFLQKALAQQPNIEEICCTDFEGVVRIAEKQFRHPVVSESDAENRAALSSFYKALRRGGVLVGFFPTIFCAVDIESIDSSVGMAKSIDLKRSSFYEKKQGLHQIFYTPLRLRYILKAAGFSLDKMEICFLDSDFLVKGSTEYYGLKDNDTVLYELFVVAVKQLLRRP